MLEASHFSPGGARHDAAFALPGDYFDGAVNEPVLHQAVTAYLNNQRQGTHQTKTRAFVSGGNSKPWKQKGTGRARAGSTRSPLWRGGGIVFGPHPRDYRTDIPRKVRQLARKSALNARAAEGSLLVVERLAFTVPRTARLVELLNRLGVAGKKVLVLTNGSNGNVFLSGRNIPDVQVMNYPEASAYEILWSDAVIVEQGALTGEAPETDDDGSSLDVRQPRQKREPAAEKPKKKAAKAEKAAKAAKAAKAEKTVKAKAAKPKAAKRKKPAAKPRAKPKAAKKPVAKAKKAPKKKGGK